MSRVNDISEMNHMAFVTFVTEIQICLIYTKYPQF